MSIDFAALAATTASEVDRRGRKARGAFCLLFKKHGPGAFVDDGGLLVAEAPQRRAAVVVVKQLAARRRIAREKKEKEREGRKKSTLEDSSSFTLFFSTTSLLFFFLAFSVTRASPHTHTRASKAEPALDKPGLFPSPFLKKQPWTATPRR